MKNEYRIVGDVIFIKIKHKEIWYETQVSTKHLDRLLAADISWYGIDFTKGDTMYVEGYIRNSKLPKSKRHVLLHRFLTDATKGTHVDHRDHDGLNNTDSNLRVVTPQENYQNRKGAYRSNKTSGIRGVSWSKAAKKWCGHVTINYKYHHIGLFDTKEDAEVAVVEFRRNHMPFSVMDVDGGEAPVL